MLNDKVSVPAQDVQAFKSYKPLFQLGHIVATRAVLTHLEKHAIFPAALLSRHEHGDWGTVDPDDALANRQALQSGARLMSVYVVEYVVIWVVTESAGDDGNRASTCLLLPGEY